MRRKIIKLFKAVYVLLASLAALTALGVVFWIKIKPWVYAEWFLGADTSQYIYYVVYYLKHPHFPVNAWDYFWHNGVPRVIDLTWLHFTLNTLLARLIGLYESIKFYPLIYLGLTIFFAYLLFLDLSGSALLALGLAASLTVGEAIYSDLFSAGVVLSSISHAFLPMTLFFLVRFYKTQKKAYLIIGGVSAALGLYSHGLMGMFWVFIPSFIFLLLATRSWKRLIDKESLVNAFLFAIVTLSVGALASWPHLLQALKGGSNRLMFEKVNAVVYRSVFSEMWKLNDWGITYAFIVSVFVALGFLLFAKKRPNRLLGAFGGILVFYLLWLLSYRAGINPLVGVLFPGRIFWIWVILLGSMTAVLLGPLSQISGQKTTVVLGKLIGFNLVKLVIFIFSILSLSVYLTNFDYFKEAIKKEEFKRVDIGKHHYELNKTFLSLVDPTDTNVRLWTHIPVLSLTWKSNSDISLSEGYAHIWTKLSRGWEGWLFAVLSQPNWETQEIPREMVKEQAKFFLDWYGIKYLIGITDVDEYAVSPYFYEEDNDCIQDSRIAEDESKTTIFVVDQSCTSGIVSPIKSPVIGFVGGDVGYENFLKDMAMLNLNTAYLIPVKISNSISGISSDKLALIDALVIYDFKKGNPLFYASGWNKVLGFIKNGGKVWIEGGGNSAERENSLLPAAFPITASQYGSLDKDWQPGGELAKKINFSSLEPLVYRGTPWQVSYAPEGAVKPGARVLLTQKGYPVAVKQEVGEGKVLWTGINSFYRPEEFRKNGMKEIRLIEVFLESLMGELPAKRGEAEISRPTPENILVEGENFSGVVLKETNWPGWQAKVKSAGKTKRVPVLTAGPELMYIPISKDMREGKIKVLIDYKGAFIYWLSFFVSLISFLVVVLYLIFGGFILRRFIPAKTTKYFKGTKARISSWWESEEE